jgi:Protein of unknown function (DUF3093)
VTSFTERLRVPVSWWLLAAGFLASLWLALAVALPGPLVWTVFGLAAVLVVALLLGYGGTRVAVTTEGLVVGRAVLDWPACGPATALDSAATRRQAGVEADARAYLVLRPYLREAVRVEVVDPSDPTPYWLISTRHPARLAAEIEAARSRA